MNKKVLSNILIGLILLSGAGYFVYSRTKQIEKCDVKLKNYSENHACIITTRGAMVFELYPSEAPKSVEHFKSLANDKKFYDGLEFYRVSKDFVVQGGIQDFQVRTNNTSNIQPAMEAKLKEMDNKIETEANFDKLNLNQEAKDALAQEGFTSNPNLNSRVFELGSLSFANAGPNTNSTEIFIVTGKDKDNTQLKYLRGRFTNIGQIVEGQDVLAKLNESQLRKNYQYSQEKPLDPINIIEIRVK